MTTPTTPPNESLSAFHASASQLQQRVNKADTALALQKDEPLLEDLRRQLAEGVEWWTGYDIRQAREALHRIEQTYDTAKRRVQPAQKFRFRRRAHAAPATSAVGPPPPAGDAALQDADSGAVYGAADVKDGVVTCGEHGGRDVTIRGLAGVRVSVGAAGAVRCLALERCAVTTGRVEGSVYVGACVRCTVVTQARQLRVHDTRDTDFVVSVASGPVIERCRGVRFGPRGGVAEGDGGMWREVKDFSWLREGESPNWRVIDGDREMVARGKMDGLG